MPHQNTKRGPWVSYAASFENCRTTSCLSISCNVSRAALGAQRHANPRLCRCAHASGAVVSSQCLFGRGISAPAFARIFRHRRGRGPWQNSPAPGFRGVKPQENNSRKYPVNLPKNTVNLSKFIEFFGNSLSLSEAIGSAMIPAFSSSSVPANAGKCGARAGDRK